MSLYLCSNNKLTKRNTLPRCKEKTVQRLIENNLEVLEMKLIASEYPTTTGGRIDSLAVDSDGAIVIIEYKRGRDSNVINQALSYRKWLTAQTQEFFEMLIQSRLGNEVAENIRLDCKNPRVVCIAESFSKIDIDTVQVVPLRIDLYKYRHYEGNLFSLDIVNTDDQQGIQVKACDPMSVQTTQGIIDALKQQSGASHTLLVLFDDLRELIMQMDEFITEKPKKSGIAYRIQKNFADIVIRKDRLVINLRPTDYDDPRGMVEKLGEEGYVISMNRRITLTESDDLDYVFDIISQSYENVL